MKASLPGKELLLAHEFARRAGVTVRTLHHYDRLGLLRPRTRTSTGFRLYGRRELERLEQIVALKFLGFPLKQIGDVLDHEGRSLASHLRLQREVMQERQQRLEQAIRAIAAAEHSLAAGEEAGWDALRHIIEVIHMQQDTKWVEKYFTPEQLATIRSGQPWTPELQERVSRQWKELGADLEAAAEEELDPASPQAQALVERFESLIHGFTRGDQGVLDGLRKMYADRASQPNRDWTLPYNEAARDWLARARKHRQAESGA